jgi:alkylation response protein AidB-like acyl-CoA dehydrogenase
MAHFRKISKNALWLELYLSRCENLMPEQDVRLREASTILSANAEASDVAASWPAESWEAVRRAGVLRWCISAAYGGDDLDSVELLCGYEQLASACLTSCFILSQREAACRRLRDSANEGLRRRLLPDLAQGRSFATVGLSQLTTSRQHVQPTLVATRAGESFVLNGTIPWVTGAERAEHIVIGALLEEGQQILAVLPRDSKGVRVAAPLRLMALEGSLTAEVRCENVALGNQWLLAGPAQRVITLGKSGTGGLETSCLALGLAGAAVEYLKTEAVARPELRSSTERLEHTRQALRQEMHRLAKEGCTAEAAAGLRARANALVLRSTQAALTASKGTGFVRPHPAQRWARQALFFLVWSCPRPAADATLAYLAGPEGGLCQ